MKYSPFSHLNMIETAFYPIIDIQNVVFYSLRLLYLCHNKWVRIYTCLFLMVQNIPRGHWVGYPKALYQVDIIDQTSKVQYFPHRLFNLFRIIHLFRITYCGDPGNYGWYKSSLFEVVVYLKQLKLLLLLLLMLLEPFVPYYTHTHTHFRQIILSTDSKQAAWLPQPYTIILIKHTTTCRQFVGLLTSTKKYAYSTNNMLIS